eukprot:EG_transcript_45600
MSLHVRDAFHSEGNINFVKFNFSFFLNRYGTGCGRTPQAKEFKHTRGRWPVKSVEYVQNLLKNAVANANTKGLDPNAMFISHIQANRAQQQRRRTYRAHGRINRMLRCSLLPKMTIFFTAYMSNPCHL